MADLKPLAIPGAMKMSTHGPGKERTANRQHTLGRAEPRPRMIITNALYYLGDWERPFDANSTFDKEFTMPSPPSVPFMHSSWYVRITKTTSSR